MRTDPEIRQARRSDLDAIADMARALAEAVKDRPPDLTRELLETMLLGEDRWCDSLVATVEDKPVGYVLASREFEAHTGIRRLRIADLFVTESARKLGAGAKLFAAVVERARASRCQEIGWEVWNGNAPAFAFYESLGACRAEDISLMRFVLG